MTGSNRYRNNRSCATCGTPVEAGFLYCRPHAAEKREPYTGRFGQSLTLPGAPLFACCGEFRPLLPNGKTSCCGRVVLTLDA